MFAENKYTNRWWWSGKRFDILYRKWITGRFIKWELKKFWEYWDKTTSFRRITKSRDTFVEHILKHTPCNISSYGDWRSNGERKLYRQWNIIVRLPVPHIPRTTDNTLGIWDMEKKIWRVSKGRTTLGFSWN